MKRTMLSAISSSGDNVSGSRGSSFNAFVRQCYSSAEFQPKKLPLALPCGVFLPEGLERKRPAVSPALKSDNAVNIDIAPALLQLCDRRRFRRRPLVAVECRSVHRSIPSARRRHQFGPLRATAEHKIQQTQNLIGALPA